MSKIKNNDLIFSKLINSVLSYNIKLINKIKNNNGFIIDMEKVSKSIINCYQNNKKVLICGNGGSAADSQHIAAELIGKFQMIRPALYAEALSTNTSVLTSIGNDFSFDDVFSRQIEGKGNAGDILIGITTSGKSKNIIKAFKIAEEKEMINICFTGGNPDKIMSDLCKVVIKVPSSITARIQEIHIMMFHIICEHVERVLFQ